MKKPRNVFPLIAVLVICSFSVVGVWQIYEAFSAVSDTIAAALAVRSA